jgi:hypothetical protein
MKTCFVHVGPHKTGSSSVQEFLRQNREGLLRNNVEFATFANGKFDVKLLASDSFLRGDDDAITGEGWDEFRHLLEGEKDLILSDECFSDHIHRPEFLPRLAHLLSEYGFHLVLISVHREQASHINSSYVQAVKRFYTGDDIDVFARSALGALRYSYWQMRTLARQAEVEHRAILFDHAVKNSSLGAEFVRCLGMDPAEFPPMNETPINPNAGALTVLASLRIKSQWPGVPNPQHDKEAYKAFRRYFRKHRWEDEPYFGISEDLQKEIYQRFFDENDDLCRSTLGRGWDDVVPFRTRRVSARSYESLSERERHEIDVIVKRIVRLAPQ